MRVTQSDRLKIFFSILISWIRCFSTWIFIYVRNSNWLPYHHISVPFRSSFRQCLNLSKYEKMIITFINSHWLVIEIQLLKYGSEISIPYWIFHFLQTWSRFENRQQMIDHYCHHQMFLTRPTILKRLKIISVNDENILWVHLRHLLL